MENKCKTTIGGQAVIEGVMMRGKTCEAIAVRAESGEVLLETKRIKSKSKASKIPVIRGAVAFFSSLINGTKALMRSASVFGEDESSNFDKWLSKKLKISAVEIATTLGVILGLALSLLLFFFLPQVIADLFFELKSSSKELLSIKYNLFKSLKSSIKSSSLINCIYSLIDWLLNE